MVLAVVADYVSKQPEATFSELQALFPKQLQGPMGVFNRADNVRDISFGHPKSLKIADQKIAVCTQRGAGTIDGFIDRAI